MPAARRSQHTTVAASLASQVVPKRANNIVALQRYYQSAELLLRQAEIYRIRGIEHQQYVMLMRYASLIIETLPQHKDYRASDPEYRRLKQLLAEKTMPELEGLYSAINMKHALGAPPSEPGKALYTVSRPADTTPLSLSNLPQVDWGSVSSTYSPGQPWADGAAAVGQGGQMDLLSGNAVSPASVPNLLPFDVSSSTSRLPVASREARMRHAVLATEDDRERRRNPQQQAGALAQPRPLYPAFDSRPLPPIDYGIAREVDAQPSAPPLQGSLMDEAPSVTVVPPPPAPPELTDDLQKQVDTDVKPQLELQLGPQEVGVASLAPPTGPPTGDACCAPGSVAAAPAATATVQKEYQGMRDVHVSVALMEEFMRYAIDNTRRNIETIGLLGGSLSEDGSAFTINTLIIPKQKGSTDRVEMVKEEEIWDIFFQDDQAATHALFPVGWIHTHPAFDCFLSSVDMHNQYGYQVMLEEAIAIVMAPRDSRNRKCGLFRLSTPGGMKTIRDCPSTGFHTHAPTETGQKIYELCNHVYLNPRVRHKVINLRE